MKPDKTTPMAGNWLHKTLIIIGFIVLAALFTPKFSSYFPSYKTLKAKNYLEKVVRAQNKYFQNNHRYAETTEKLVERKYLKPKEEIIVHILLSPSKKSYTMEAYHTKGNRKLVIGMDGRIKETELDKKAP